MAKRNNPLKNVKLVFKRSSTLTKTVVICTILLSTITLVTLHNQLIAAEGQLNDLKDQAADMEQEKNQLLDYISELGTVDGVKRIAQEILGLVEPFFTIFQPQD